LRDLSSTSWRMHSFPRSRVGMPSTTLRVVCEWNEWGKVWSDRVSSYQKLETRPDLGLTSNSYGARNRISLDGVVIAVSPSRRLMVTFCSETCSMNRRSTPRRSRQNQISRRARPRVDALETRLAPATLMVVTTADSGPGSLRAAILAANQTTGRDEIDFDLPGQGPHTIRPTSPLPQITDPVVIDGYTQPGAHANTRTDGTDDAVIDVELSGEELSGGGSIGLDMFAGSSVVRGLAIGRFSVGVRMSSPSGSYGGENGDAVEGDFVGLDATGAENRGNGTGILVLSSSGNTIGGAAAAARNVISANGSDGVAVTGDYREFGGFAVMPASFHNVIVNNLIGTDATGALDRGNGGAGIDVATAGGATTIGGAATGLGNFIAFNHGAGVLVTGANSGVGMTDSGGFGPSLNNTILSNSIFENLGLGIDLGGDGRSGNQRLGIALGPNLLLNHPVITAITRTAADTTIAGALLSQPNQTYTLQFFADDASSPLRAQGRNLVGTIAATTNSEGRADFTFLSPVVLPDGQNVTATATDGQGNTSEFSPATTDLANLTLRLESTPAIVGPGERLSQALTITNSGPTPTTGVRVVGTLTASGDRAPFSTANPSPLAGAVITATTPQGNASVSVSEESRLGETDDTAQFSAALGDLAVGQSVVIVLTIELSAAPRSDLGSILESFSGSSDLGELDLQDASVSFRQTVAASDSDLTVALVGPTAPPRVGQVFAMTATVTNRGPSAENAAVLTVTPTNGLAIVSVSSGTVDPTTGDLKVSVGALGPGEAATISISVRPALGGVSAALSAAVTGSNGDSNSTNNASTVSVQAVAVSVSDSDLTVELVGPTAPPRVGQVFAMSATVTNLGPSIENAAVLTVTPTNGLVIVGASSGTVDPTTGGLKVSVRAVGPGEAATISILVRPVLGGVSAALSAAVTGSNGDSNPKNNTSIVSLAIPPSGPRIVGSSVLIHLPHRGAAVVVTFSEVLKPARLRARRHYRIVSAGRDQIFGTRDDRRIAIRRVAYSAATRSVTLKLARAPKTPLQLRILSGGKSTLFGLSGLPLDGNADGVPGGDFIGRIV
jgi:hypothetical protein